MIPLILSMIVKQAIKEGGVFYPTNIHSLSQQILIKDKIVVNIAALNVNSLTQQVMSFDPTMEQVALFRINSFTQQVMVQV